MELSDPGWSCLLANTSNIASFNSSSYRTRPKPNQINEEDRETTKRGKNQAACRVVIGAYRLTQ